MLISVQFLILVLASASSGCAIHAWRIDSSNTLDESQPTSHLVSDAVLYYNVPELFEKAPGWETEDIRVRVESARKFAALLEHALASNATFGKAVLTSAPPPQGHYVSIDVIRLVHLNGVSVAKLLLCSATLLIVPCYFDGVSEYKVSYHLFKDGTVVQTFQESVRQRSLMWNLMLLAIPFVYESWGAPPWTSSKEEALAATAKGFLSDAHHGGHF